jgi:ubiquinone/menaquinone biosynthesis C-methylase UbiE
MTIFDQIASDYDVGMAPLEWLIFRRLRRQLFPSLQGRVLELAIGTGANLPLYPPGARVIGCDISREMLTHAGQRAANEAVPLLQADVRHLPFASDSFDVVSASLAFCSVADPLKGLGEARRVLRAGGRLALLEHTRGNGLGAWLTDLLHPLWHAKSRECHLNRETARHVAQAGFVIERVRRYVLGIVRVIEASR